MRFSCKFAATFYTSLNKLTNKDDLNLTPISFSNFQNEMLIGTAMAVRTDASVCEREMMLIIWRPRLTANSFRMMKLKIDCMHATIQDHDAVIM